MAVTGARAVGCMHTGAPPTAVQGALELVDGDGVLAISMVVALHPRKPSPCEDQPPTLGKSVLTANSGGTGFMWAVHQLGQDQECAESALWTALFCSDM